MLLKVFFSLAIIADKQMFKALVMVELLDSEEEEETKGRGMTRSWLRSWTSSSVHFFLLFLIVFFVCSTVSLLCESIL